MGARVMVIEVISATRRTETDFWQNAALGVSLRRLAEDDKRLVARVAYENRLPLPDLFNICIRDNTAGDVLVFIHDDVWIDDYYFGDRILDALQTFDIVGVAGNRRRLAGQPAWAFVDDVFTLDDRANLSGAIAHGDHPFGEVSMFGATPAECELLDGVFLAARREALAGREVLFDPRFDFHFYDLDFCRTARSKGLRLGTWPICLTHQSAGAFNTPPWHDKLRLYREKWGA
jgi:GT2 family glycosyltransferase